MFMQAFYFAVQGSDEKLHEGGDFLHRTVPVLAAEGIKRECIQMVVGGKTDRTTYRFHPCFMTEDT
ncbi:hypothetical protein D3C87_1735070 [compost metagenome]